MSRYRSNQNARALFTQSRPISVQPGVARVFTIYARISLLPPKTDG